jgi:hypothetical protein
MRLIPEKEIIEEWVYTSLHPYMAPECVSSEVTDQADIFSLGTLMYWLFSDRPSFYEPMIRVFKEKLLSSVVSAELQLIGIAESIYFEKLQGLDIDMRDNIPEEIIPLIQKATTGTRRARYKDISAFFNDLLAIPTKSLRVLLYNETGNPLANLQVIVKKQTQDIYSNPEKFTGYSDGDGIFEVTDLLQGDYVVRVVDEGKSFETYQTNIEIVENTELEFTLKRFSLGKRIKQVWNKIRDN